jgi:hypothetical protein
LHHITAPAIYPDLSGGGWGQLKVLIYKLYLLILTFDTASYALFISRKVDRFLSAAAVWIDCESNRLVFGWRLVGGDAANLPPPNHNQYKALSFRA